METQYRVKFWNSANDEKPVAKWLKSLNDNDREYLGNLLEFLRNPICVVVAASRLACVH